MNEHRILIVGEDNSQRRDLIAFLSNLNLDIERSGNLPRPQAFAASPSRISLIVMPASDLKEQGVSVLREIKTSDPSLPIVILSRSSESRSLVSFLQEGLIDSVASPDNHTSIFSAIKGCLAGKQLAAENAGFQKTLAKLKQERSRHIRKALELEEVYDTTLENLMTALDLRDVETFGHSQTVAKYSQVLAELLGITDRRVLDNIRKGALLHDVGKIAIPDAILKKPGELSAPEWEKIRLHPSLGYGLVKEIKLVEEAGNIILCHHEKYDGSGYPAGLEKTEIPLEARVFAVADALDAITSHRPYRKERDFASARKEIREHSGTQFDPQIVDAFCKLPLERWEKIRFETTRLLPSIMEYHSLATKD
ncbi:MAG: HD-GYP domain-containing protein [Candidatus Aminicenantales bacterium]